MSKDPRGLLKGMPRTLTIAGNGFTVSVVEPTEENGMLGLEGLTIPDEGKIQISAEHLRTSPPVRVLTTVIHEVSHAINCLFGVEDESTEEQFVTQHSVGLVAFLLQNPRFEAWRRRLLREIAASAKAAAASSVE